MFENGESREEIPNAKQVVVEEKEEKKEDPEDNPSFYGKLPRGTVHVIDSMIRSVMRRRDQEE